MKVSGSSPRVWGQVDGLFAKREIEGIIPTRMGTRSSPREFLNLILDHPHAYGDKFVYLVRVVFLMGSSPRVWGQVHRVIYPLSGKGIIPTRMGTRNFCKCLSFKHRDHPHAYGDKVHPVIARHYIFGSSPRVWGQEP